MSKFKEMCASLEIKIQDTYTKGVSLEDAEKLAAEFLVAQLRVSEELKKADLDARMRKSGNKSIRAEIYLDIVKQNEKKPTEVQIASLIEVDANVKAEQQGLDVAEVDKAELERYYDIFLNAHIFFRGVAKGSFGG